MTADIPNPYEPPRPATAGVSRLSQPGNAAVISPEIMARAHRIHQGRRSIVYRIIAVAVGVFSLWFAVRFVLAGNSLRGVLFAGIAALLILRGAFAGHILRRTINKQYQQMGKDQEVVTYESSPEHLRIVTDDADIRIKWSDFHKWKEVDGLILAYRHAGLFQVIPVGQLDLQTQNEIREHLAAHSNRA